MVQNLSSDPRFKTQNVSIGQALGDPREIDATMAGRLVRWVDLLTFSRLTSWSYVVTKRYKLDARHFV